MTKKHRPTKTTTTKPNLEETVEAPPEPSLKEILAETNAAHLSRLDDILEKWAKTDATGKRWNGFSTPGRQDLDNLIEIEVNKGMRGPVASARRPAKFKLFGPFVTGNVRTDGFFPE